MYNYSMLWNRFVHIRLCITPFKQFKGLLKIILIILILTVWFSHSGLTLEPNHYIKCSSTVNIVLNIDHIGLDCSVLVIILHVWWQKLELKVLPWGEEVISLFYFCSSSHLWALWRKKLLNFCPPAFSFLDFETCQLSTWEKCDKLFELLKNDFAF